jgi:hypothetical protein
MQHATAVHCRRAIISASQDDLWDVPSRVTAHRAASTSGLDSTASSHHGMVHARTTACLMALAHLDPSMAYRALDGVFNTLEACRPALPFSWVAALTNAMFSVTGLLGTSESWQETVILPRLEAIGIYPHIVSNLHVRCPAHAPRHAMHRNHKHLKSCVHRS